MSQLDSQQLQELYARFGLDANDLAKSSTRYELLIHGELSSAASENRKALEVAWASLCNHGQQRLNERAVELMTTVRRYPRLGVVPRPSQIILPRGDDGAAASPIKREETTVQGPSPSSPDKEEGSSAASITAMQFAEALSELCFLGETYIFKGARWFGFPFGEELAEIACNCLLSPSRIMRLLGLQCARMYASQSSFLVAFFEHRGPQRVGLCLDREISDETEHAFGFILRLVDLQKSEHHSQSLPSFPHGLACRVASFIDPSDQLPTLAPAMRQRAMFVAIQLLETFPAHAAAADMPRLLLLVCLTKDASGDEVTAILRTILRLYDNPATRPFIKDADLACLFVPFVESGPKASAPEHIETMNIAKDVLCRLMCTWTGLMWVGSATTGLRSLVDLLFLPGPIDRRLVLITFFNQLIRRVAPHRGVTVQGPWLGNEVRRRASTQGPADFDVVETDDLGGDNCGFDLYLRNDDDLEEDNVPTMRAVGYSASDALLATMLLVLEHHGLPQALITIVKRSGLPGSTADIAQEAAILLQHVLDLMDTVLPCTSVNLLHDAFNGAIASLHSGKSALVGILTSRLCQNVTSKTIAGILTAPTANSYHNNNASSNLLLQYSYSTSNSGLQMDDVAFQQSVKESHVEQYHEPSKWNFDVLLLLIQGPLRNIAKLKWLRDNTRFLTRVVGFYRPSTLKSITTLRPEECTPNVCGFGVALIELLCSTHEGADILEKAEFAKALNLMLLEVHEGRALILTKERLNSPVGDMFCRMLGCFSRSANGLLQLRKNQVFPTIHNLFEQSSSGKPPTVPAAASPSNKQLLASATTTSANFAAAPSSTALGGAGGGAVDYVTEVCHELLQHLFLGAVPNYGVCEEIRSSLRLALSNSRSSPMRLCAVYQMKRVLWRDLSTSMEWGLQCLVEALDDPFPTVVEQSFKMLARICCSSDQALEYLISLKPVALIRCPILRENRRKWGTSVLLYTIAGTENGLSFLMMHEWVDQELVLWRSTESGSYAEEVERASQGLEEVAWLYGSPSHTSRASFNGAPRNHSRSMSGSGRARGVSFAFSNTTQNYLPIHFAAELCRTQRGCALFVTSELWKSTIDTIVKHAVWSDAELSAAQAAAEGMDHFLGSTMASPAATPDLKSTTSPSAFEAKFLPMGRVDTEIAEELDELAIKAQELTVESPKHLRKQTSQEDGKLLLSAARGYATMSGSQTMRCTGDLVALKRAILTACNVGSSSHGFALVSSTVGPSTLVGLLTALANYADPLSIRGIAIVGLSLLCRSKEAQRYLIDRQYSVLHSAYTSTAGTRFAVSYAHPYCPLWLQVRRVESARTQQPRNAYRDGQANAKGVMREIADALVSLANPVSREGAKSKLYAVLKSHPDGTLLDANTIQLIMDVTSMYRMRHTERLFVAQLIGKAFLPHAAK